MNTVTVDFKNTVGAVKPMHAVNNGPVYKFASDQRITNIDHFRAAGIPYARTHDASFFATYGGEHTVDVNMIFTDPDADPADPASYDFVLTDEYMRVMEFAGVKPFYRLGSKIEHWKKKYNTLPPKDFHKWAVVCEHIIRHYNEGWADGFYMNIEYWEIWNEPDLDPDDSDHKRCWGGTAKEFYEFFNVALTHLKTCFPNLKIGGPACAGLKEPWLEGFFASLGDVKPDFFSWHVYAYNTEKILTRLRRARQLLDEHGLQKTESILNEWNYVKGWMGDEWLYSLKMEKALKGASFTSAVMLSCQYEPLDMLMYYDARPCGMNGLFSTDYVCDRLKGYYPFLMFNSLYRQKAAVKPEIEGEDIYAAAAAGDEQNLMLTYYNDDDSSPEKEVKVTFRNVENEGRVRLEYYLLDDDHDAELVREEIFTSNEFSAYVKMPLFSTYLFKIVKE